MPKPSSTTAHLSDAQDLHKPQPTLSPVHAIALIVGIVVGAGIFKSPSVVAELIAAPEWMFGAWLLPAAEPTAPLAVSHSAPGLQAFGLAMVFVLLSFGGWNEAATISAELRDGPRNMCRVLLISLAIITALYLLVIWAYWHGLGMTGMARSDAVAASLLEKALGRTGASVMALLVIASTLTSINATIIVGARSSYAAGRDWSALRYLGQWQGLRGTPANALRVQCLMTLVLIAAGTWAGDGFRAMVEFTAPVFWFFFLLSGISLFVLRWREPDVRRPFRVPLYPLIPLLFCLMSAAMLWASLAHVGQQSLAGINASWVGVIVLAAGVILLWWVRKSECGKIDQPERSA